MTLRCLIVDDSPRFLDAAHSLLERQGIMVGGVAATSAEALRQAAELDGPFGAPQPTGDAGVGAPLRHQCQHLALRRRRGEGRVHGAVAAKNLLAFPNTSVRICSPPRGTRTGGSR